MAQLHPLKSEFLYKDMGLALPSEHPFSSPQKDGKSVAHSNTFTINARPTKRRCILLLLIWVQ